MVLEIDSGSHIHHRQPLFGKGILTTATVDLHCHSRCSDGSLSPSEVVQRAASRGIKALALTDHDTVAGLAEAAVAAQQNDLVLISGCEFSCQWRGAGVHIVGLNFDVSNLELQQFLRQQRLLRWERAICIGEKLSARKCPGVLAQIGRDRDGVPPSRPEIAQAMVAMGYVKSIQEAFRLYLGAGKVAEVPQIWPSCEEVVAVVKDAGGAAVIAHPGRYKLGGTKLRTLFSEFKEAGGDAVEVVYCGQKQGEALTLSTYASRFGLKASVGSDFHSPEFGWADFGRLGPLPKGAVALWTAWQEPSC